MLEDLPVAGENPKIMSLYMPGGALMGFVPLATLARIEELTGKPITDLFQHFEGASVSGYLIAGINLRKNNNPEHPDYNKPRYSMKEGLKLFVEKTPEVFPDIKSRELKMLLGQSLDAVFGDIDKDFEGWLPSESLVNGAKHVQSATDDLLECDIDDIHWLQGSLCFVFDKWSKAVETAVELRTQATVLPFSLLQDLWAKDYMYDPKDLENLFQDVLGQDTKLSDLMNSVSIASYNMSNERVEFFTNKKENPLSSNSLNEKVSHDDPFVWQVSMGATANIFAYKPYVLNGKAYFDGAMFHHPTSYQYMEGSAGEAEIVLVNILSKPEGSRHVGDLLSESKPFAHVVELTDQKMPKEPEELREVFGNFIYGAYRGGFSHVNQYIEDMETLNENNSGPSGGSIVIAPKDVLEGEDSSIRPSMGEAFTATPENISKILDYTDRMLAQNDFEIRALAKELVANQVRLGRVSIDEYKKIAAEIDQQAYESSTLPTYLTELKEMAHENTFEPTPKPSMPQVPNLSASHSNS